MKNTVIDSFVDAYTESIQNQTAAVFAGAGLSISAGMVDWKGLLKSIAREVGLSVDKESDLVTLAQFHVNERGGRHGINQALINEFTRRADTTENHRILSALPIKTYWTTNYDTIIEDSLKSISKTPDVKITTKNLALTLPHRDAVVYKMHGDISQPEKAVITKDDYEAYEAHRHLFSAALQGDLVSKTFLFIGFSFSDPNLSYILGRIRILLGENRRDHYCLLRRVQRSDFKAVKEFQYATAKQELQVKDLRRYGIQGLLVEKYSDYTAILKRISNKFRMRRVFISGSAATYGTRNPVKVQKMIQNIAQQLVKAGFGIVSGFGSGVGEFVVNGILMQVEKEGSRRLDDRIVFRPFPFNIPNASERKKRWTAYRKEMIELAGTAIFLFGNKLDSDGKVIDADGIEEEFELSVAMGLSVIPVGSTGYMASKLHKRVCSDIEKYFPKPGFKNMVVGLGKNPTPAKVTSNLVKICNKLRDEK